MPFLLISSRLAGESFSALAFPPALPLTARPGAFPSLSTISPVAIRPTMTAAEFVSAGRRTPLGPLGIVRFTPVSLDCPERTEDRECKEGDLQTGQPQWVPRGPTPSDEPQQDARCRHTHGKPDGNLHVTRSLFTHRAIPRARESLVNADLSANLKLRHYRSLGICEHQAIW